MWKGGKKKRNIKEEKFQEGNTQGKAMWWIYPPPLQKKDETHLM